jgi:isorenieratene synthase
MSQDTSFNIGRKLPPVDAISDLPDWKQAQPAWIESALREALALPSGGWYVVDGVRAIRDEPLRYRIASEDYVVWRSGERILVAPDGCPHMGARLSDGFVKDGCVVCPWHGLALGEKQLGRWKPLETFNDGVLLWARPPSDEPATEEPIVPTRPSRFFDAVMRLEARCDPRDVVANRLDPWHGAYFHPHSFGRLKVINKDESTITVRVVYRITKRIGMEVDAVFDCPDPRTIVMTIIRGEGVGSVVETHATPIEPGRSAVIEATLAASDRPQFHWFMSAFSRLVRPVVEKRARRLWVEDGQYAERRYELRMEQETLIAARDAERNRRP